MSTRINLQSTRYIDVCLCFISSKRTWTFCHYTYNKHKVESYLSEGTSTVVYKITYSGKLPIHKRVLSLLYYTMLINWNSNGSQITGLLNSPQPGQLLLRTNLVGKVKDATLVTSNLNTPPEDWELKPSSIGRAAKFINHPDNLPDIDFSVDKPSDSQTGTEPKYNLRRAIKAPTKPTCKAGQDIKL